MGGPLRTTYGSLFDGPILAKVYADIAVDEAVFNPRTEYDLLNAAWSRISAPTDIGLIRKLAGTIREQNPIYPWPTEYVSDHGGPADAVKRLTQQGWLRDDGDGNVAMWHHRFLYWAHAKSLVAEFKSGRLTIVPAGRDHSRLPPAEPTKPVSAWIRTDGRALVTSGSRFIIGSIGRPLATHRCVRDLRGNGA